MMGKNLVETIMGGFVLVVAALFLTFAYFSAHMAPASGYTVHASFSSVGGLSVGSDVRIGGVKVGSVTDQGIDPKTYRADVAMTVNREVKLPTDSKAVISSEGLIGGKYVKLEPGTSSTLVKPGGTLGNTEGAVDLESLLGRIIFLATDQGPAQGQGGNSSGQAPAPGQKQAPSPLPGRIAPPANPAKPAPAQ